MIQLTVITVGNLKESYWRDAVAEYEKRLCAFCKPTIVQLKEAKLPDDPSPVQIEAALSDEAERILAAMPPRSYGIALCVEGKQLSSEELASRLESITSETGNLCLVIGSSHGLSERVKAACRMRLSVSKLTFPHQMMRVILLETVYRAFSIVKGTKYHK